MYVQLSADLNMEETDWIPIGAVEDMEGYSTMFFGTFGGGGDTISGLTYQLEDFIIAAGLFWINCGIIGAATGCVEGSIADSSTSRTKRHGVIRGIGMGRISSMTIVDIIELQRKFVRGLPESCAIVRRTLQSIS